MGWIATSVLAVALVAASAASGQNRHIDQVLQRQFPGQRAETAGERSVNGVRVYEIRLLSDRGESTAVVTEFGDFLSTSTPVRRDRLPSGVGELLTTLFRDSVAEVEKSEQTYYLIDVGEGRRRVRLEMDATGRLHNLYTGNALRQAESLDGYERATEREADEVRQRVEKYFDNPRLKEVYRHPDSEGFFVARLTADRGDVPVTAVIDPRSGEISEWRIEIDSQDIPRPVMDGVTRMLGDAAVRRAQRSMADFYRTKVTLGDDALALRIRPTGEVMGVRSDRVTEEEGRPGGHRIDVGRGVDRDRDVTRPDPDRRTLEPREPLRRDPVDTSRDRQRN